jgi:hypothetical protein
MPIVRAAPHSATNMAMACARCAERAAATPPRPSPQERLYNKIVAADAGPLRDELAAALRHGAEITLWITGPGPDLAKHHAKLDEITESRDALAAALSNGGRLGLAHVLHGSWRSTVVLGEDGRALIGRGPT